MTPLDMIQRIMEWMTAAVTALYAVAILGILPLYSEEGYNHIGTDKAMFFRRVGIPLLAGAIVCGLFWVAVAYINGYKKEQEETFLEKLKREMSVTDWCAAGYLAVLLVSYLCTDYPTTAVWGETGWFMGLVPQFCLVGTYFLISRAFRKSQWLFYIIFPVSFFVFILGILNRYNIYPIQMSSNNPSFISTIGNVNWYCGYWAVIFFAGLALLWKLQGKRGYCALLAVYGAVGFATGITQGSDSAFVAFGAVLFGMFLLSLRDGGAMQRYLALLALLSAVCQVIYMVSKGMPEALAYVSGGITIIANFSYFWLAALVFLVLYMLVRRMNTADKYSALKLKRLPMIFLIAAAAGTLLCVGAIAWNTIRPGSLGPLSANGLFTFDESWGSYRGASLRAGLTAWGDQDILHKLVGIGPDGMACYLYSGQNTELGDMLIRAFGDARLTNAHCEWLSILANVGVLGLAAFAGMMISAILRFLKAGKQNIWAYACGFAILAYTANNIVSFQQTMNTTQMFIILGIGEGILRQCRRNGHEPRAL